MPDFRDYTPKRRNITRNVNSHGDHKIDLKLDFKSRCGYCHSTDEWKLTYYEVDHFVPLNILTHKAPTDYTNLIYACRSCNNAKRKKWPTKDELVANRNDEGFIDPCDDEYNTHFSRRDTGEIEPVTNLGNWMYKALKLHKPQHAIIWNLEQLDKMIKEIEALNSKLKDHPIVKELLLETFKSYRAYEKQFRSL